MRTTVNSVIINDDKEILLVKKRDTRILPWWKPEEWETDLECLNREVEEELNWAKLKNIRFYGNFIWKTPHKWDYLKAKVYFAELITDTLKATAELSEAKFIKNFNDYNISDITSKVLNWLRETWNL